MIAHTCATIKAGGYSREDYKTKVFCVSFPRVLSMDVCEVLNEFEITEEMMYDDFCKVWGLVTSCRATGVKEFNKIIRHVIQGRFLDSNFYQTKTSTGECVIVTYCDHLLAMVVKTFSTFTDLKKKPHEHHVLAGTSVLVLFCGLKPSKFAQLYTGVYAE